MEVPLVVDIYIYIYLCAVCQTPFPGAFRINLGGGWYTTDRHHPTKTLSARGEAMWDAMCLLYEKMNHTILLWALSPCCLHITVDRIRSSCTSLVLRSLDCKELMHLLYHPEFQPYERFLQVCVCVCVWMWMCVCAPCSHRDFFELFSFAMSRGAQEAHRAVPNEALYGDLRICSLISCTYLLFEVLNKL